MTSLPTPAAVQAVRDAVRGALLLESGRTTTWRYQLVGARLDADEFVAAITRHRVLPLLADAAEELDLPASLTTALRQRRDAGRLLSMTQLRELGRVQEAMESAGVRWLAFKGPVLAAQTTGDFRARGAGDLDVLVAPEDVAAAWAALVDAGWRHHPQRPRPDRSWSWRHHLDTHYELPMLGEPAVVDLHWGLHPARGVLPDFDSAFARRETVAVGPWHVPTLSPGDALVHACAHAARDEYRWLRHLVDVHRLVRTLPASCSTSINPGGTPLREPAVRAALAVTADSIGLPPGAVGSARLRPRAGVVRRARAAQDQPVPERGTDFPGTRLARAVRRNARGGSAAEHARVAWGLVLSPAVGVDVPDERAVTAVPRIAARRARHATQRLSGWARRGR